MTDRSQLSRIPWDDYICRGSCMIVVHDGSKPWIIVVDEWLMMVNTNTHG